MTDSVSHPMQITHVTQEGCEMRHLVLTAPDGFRFGAGQYVQLGFGDEEPAYFAIASAPEQRDVVEFLVKDGTGVAGRLYGAKPGDTVRVSAPMGPGFPKADLLGKNVVLIGVGSGMAPLRSVIGSILADRSAYGERVVLLYGAKTPFHIPFRPEIAKWRGRMEVYKAMSQPSDADWSGYVGYVQHILEDVEIPKDNTIACVCGMTPMVDAVKGALDKLGIPEDDVYLNF